MGAGQVSGHVLLFRHRPTVVEARQIDAQDWERCEDIACWSGADLVDIEHYLAERDPGVMWIRTLQGILLAEDGDWIVKGVGGFYPVKPDVFDARFEPVVRR